MRLGCCVAALKGSGEEWIRYSQPPRNPAWRNDPFVLEQLHSIKTAADWARVTRTLDRSHGSPADQARIARRPATVRYGRPLTAR